MGESLPIIDAEDHCQNQCGGACCERIYASIDIEGYEVSDWDSLEIGFISSVAEQEFSHAKDFDGHLELQGVSPLCLIEDVIVDGKINIEPQLVFKCSKWDPDSRQCTIYESRPKPCQSFTCDEIDSKKADHPDHKGEAEALRQSNVALNEIGCIEVETFLAALKASIDEAVGEKDR